MWNLLNNFCSRVSVIAVIQDLNRVLNKPYTENKDDTSGRPDEVIILSSHQPVCYSILS